MATDEFGDASRSLQDAIASHPASGRAGRRERKAPERDAQSNGTGRLYRLVIAIREASENLGYDGPLFPPTDF